MKSAPIAISVFDRPIHFRQCIQSLQKNIGSEDATLFIASDGPKDQRSKILVDQVREYIKTIDGFQNIIVYAPHENTGKQIWYETRRKVAESNSCYICSEDDNIFSPYFLNFINDGLLKYKYDSDVAAICGYSYPGFPVGSDSTVALRRFSAWGYGTWRDKDLLLNPSMPAAMADFFADEKLFRLVHKSIPHLGPMMREILMGRLMAGDVYVCLKLFQNKSVCIFPSESLVRNIGNDGSGQHCGVNNIFSSQRISKRRIYVDALKSTKPVDSYRRWLYDFDGGKKAELKSLTIFWEVNNKKKILRFALRCLSLAVRFFRKNLSQRHLKI